MPINPAEPPKVTERTMLDLLNIRYGTYSNKGIRYTRAEHVKNSTGLHARRICDYLAMDMYSGGSLHGHEVKVSRADWLTELKDPSKAEAFAQYCDYWWLVVSDKNIVKAGELPDGWGLMIASPTGLRASIGAKRRDNPLPMPRAMQASYTRAIMKTTLRLQASGEQAVAWVRRSMRLPI